MRREHAEMTREQLLRVGHLLHMRYKPSEIAEEIGCNTDTVYRSFLPAGCPHERDKNGHIWIIGSAFRDWARDTFKRKGAKMPEGFAYCLRCRQPVRMAATVEKPVNHYLTMIAGTCEKCGAKVNRAKRRA